jgi:hypothetical protein
MSGPKAASSAVEAGGLAQLVAATKAQVLFRREPRRGQPEGVDPGVGERGAAGPRAETTSHPQA